MEIVKKTSTVHTSAYAGRPIQYIVLHYTAGTSSKGGVARNVASMFANPNNRAASADFIIDDSEIVQFNGDIRNRYTYAVGGDRYSVKYTSESGRLYGKCRNYNSVSIEMCSTKVNKKSLLATDTDWSISGAVVDKAVELTKYLMKTYNVPADRVVMHHTVTGKLCPQPWCINESALKHWYAFKARLTGGSAIQQTEPVTKEVDYTVKVKDETGLNCRAGAGAGYSIVAAYPSGTVLHITKEKSGWGYTGLGWVNLAYTAKVGTAAPNKKEDELDMTKKEFMESLTPEECYGILAEALAHASRLAEPAWSQREGHWKRAVENGVINGGAPERLIQRDEIVAILGRLGLV